LSWFSEFSFKFNAYTTNCCSTHLSGFCRKNQHTVAPRVINVDKNAAYPKAVDRLKAQERLAPDCELRQMKYLNNLIEQDHRFIKRRTRPGLGFFAFDTAQRMLSGYETMHMIRKGQVRGGDKGDILAQVHLIESLFGVAA